MNMSYQFGIEEEYFLAEATTRGTPRRNVVCGMHVHVEVPRPDVRVDLMTRLLPCMPLLLALSTMGRDRRHRLPMPSPRCNARPQARCSR